MQVNNVLVSSLVVECVIVKQFFAGVTKVGIAERRLLRKLGVTPRTWVAELTTEVWCKNADERRRRDSEVNLGLEVKRYGNQ